MDIFKSNFKLKIGYLSLILIFIFTVVNTAPAYSQIESKNVAITYIYGDVFVLKKDATEWHPAKGGDILSEGDKIKTLLAAKAKLQFSSGSTIILNENTTLLINKLDVDVTVTATKTEVSLVNGRIKAVIEGLKKESEFEVRTPNAVAGVLGTVFYLNVTKKSEGIIADSEAGKKAEAPSEDKSQIKLSFIDIISGGAKLAYAQEDEGMVTEIFVETGNVEFTNLLSDISYNVGENNGSYADDLGGITEPQAVPPETQDEWKSGFELPETGKDQKKEEDKKEEKGTKKEEKSTVEKDAAGGTGTGEVGVGDPGAGAPEIKDPSETPIEDPNKKFPQKTTTSSSTDVDIDIETDDHHLRQELVALYNDMVDIAQRIELAQLDARLEEVQDYQTGKVIKDRHGNTVRCENYVLKPTDKKVAILFLNHRRDGSDKGVSSLAFEVNFNMSLPDDLKSLPWSDYMSSDSTITYSTEPTYYPKPTTNANPSAETPAMVLTMKNPDDDYIRIYEGFGALTQVEEGIWQQAQFTLDYNAEIKGKDTASRYTNIIYSNGISAGGSWSLNIDASTYLRAYVIDDAGALQPQDIYTDGTTQSLNIGSIRAILRPHRSYNLELEAGATEFGGRDIDVVVGPEAIRPYQED